MFDLAASLVAVSQDPTNSISTVLVETLNPAQSINHGGCFSMQIGVYEHLLAPFYGDRVGRVWPSCQVWCER